MTSTQDPVGREAIPLFRRLGAEPAIDAAVDLFYQKVLADLELAPFFAGIDMPRQIKKQKAFLTVAFGGPNHYSGRAMGVAHGRAREMGMGDRHFDAVVGHLVRTLEDLGVPHGEIQEVVAIAETTRPAILGR